MSSKNEWINSSWIYKNNGLKYRNKQKSDNKNSKKFYFKLNKSKENCLNWQMRQISENENAFSQNMTWGAIDNFTYSPDKDITFASYFRRFKDLYATDCVNRADKESLSTTSKIRHHEAHQICELYLTL